MSGISRFVPKSVRFRIRRPGAVGAASLACAAMLSLGGAGFWMPRAAAEEQTCEERGATCDDPKGGPACCAWACRNRNKCDDCCRNGFPSMEEDFNKCKRECREKFPKKHSLDPEDFPAL